MLKVFLLFFWIGLFYRDDATIKDKLHSSLVITNKILNEEQWNSICTSTKFPIGSTKIAYALSVGSFISEYPIGFLLALVCFIPNLLLFGLLYFVLRQYLNSEQLSIIVNATYPVLSAYFLYCSYQYLKDSFSQSSLIKFVSLLLIDFILIFVLEINVCIVLILSMFLLLCFTKGGKVDE